MSESGQVLFLGRRWPESERLADVGLRDAWRAHYAAHRSFPVPSAPEEREGFGVVVVDAGDFAAVRTCSGFRGDWIVLAFLPDVMAIRDEYAVRVREEAKIYGGLRDLELMAVCRPDDVSGLFVLDTPARELGRLELAWLGNALQALREEWEDPFPAQMDWPARCRTANIHLVGEELPRDEGGPSPGGRWARARPDAAEDPPPSAAFSDARLVARSEPESLYRSGDAWVAVGRARPLSDFLVARRYYESHRLLLEAPEPAWPEPGAPGSAARRRFLDRHTMEESRKPKGSGDYFDYLADRVSRRHKPLEAGQPEYVLRWLGRIPGEGAG